MLYIYDSNLELMAEGPKAIIEAGVLVNIYLGMGYIVTTSKFDIVAF